MGGTDGRGQEGYEEENPGCGGQGGWCSGRTSGGAGGPQGSGTATLIEVVFRNGLGLGGIERGALVEVVGEGFLGGLAWFGRAGPHAELGLGWSSGGMKGRGRSGLTDMGEDLGNRLRISQERDERERRLAGRADEGEDFIGTGFILHLLQRV